MNKRVNNKKEGDWEFISEEGWRYRGIYKNDMKEGIWTTYTPAGVVYAYGPYYKNVRHGQWWYAHKIVQYVMGKVNRNKKHKRNKHDRGGWRTKIRCEDIFN